jgi:hypothetical protein
MYLRAIFCILLSSLWAAIPVTGQSSSEPVGQTKAQSAVTAQPMAIRSTAFTDEVVPSGCVAFVTAVSLQNNVAVFHGANHFAESQEIRLSRLSKANFLNGSPLKIVAATADSFSVAAQHENMSLTNDSGTAMRTDCPSTGDFRSEQRVTMFHNTSNYFRQHLSPDVSLFRYDDFVPEERDAHYSSVTFNQPGYTLGNQGGWGVVKNHYDEVTFNGRGIAQTSNLWCTKHAAGDIGCGDYFYGRTDGGSTAQSDEGFTMDTRIGGESDKYFHGKVGAGASAGATTLPVTFDSGQDATTDGAFILDISKETFAGRISGDDSIVPKTSVHSLPVTLTGGAKLPASTGMGVIQTEIPPPVARNKPEPIELEVNLISGTFKKGVACLAGGWYPEQVMVTDVAPVGGGAQKVTVLHKYPNPGAEKESVETSSLWQGGLCGNYISLDRNLARDGFRTSYSVVGAVDGDHVAYVWNVNGRVRPNGLDLYRDPVSLSKLTRKDGVVTATFTKANSPYIFNLAPSVMIASASDASFNGAVSSPVYTDGTNAELTWKQSGPDATAASATIDLPAAAYGFHLYPGAEVIAPRTPDGSVPLEPNSVKWAAGDVIENPHNPSFQMRFRANIVTQHTPPSGADSHAELWRFYGAGISKNFRPSRWDNYNPCNMYIGCGGTLEPITWSIHSGAYSIFEFVRNAPMNTGTLFRVGCSLLGCDHPAPYTLFELQNGRIVYDPATSTVSTASLKVTKLSVDELSLPRAQDGSCLTVANHKIVAGSCGGSAVSGGTTAPQSDAARIVAGDTVRGENAACAPGYRCTADRGRITVMTTTHMPAGKVAHVTVKLAQGEICTATQNGGAAYFGIGSGAESAGGFDITSDVGISGRVTVDYLCR